MIYYLLNFFSFIVNRMSISSRHIIGLMLGKLFWLIITQKRKQIACKNIISALKITPKQALVIAKKSTVRFGPMFFEVMTMSQLNSNNIDKVINIEGEENLKSALKSGQGAILVTAHCGNWELLGACLAIRGFPLVAVAQKQTNISIDRFINKIRKNAGIQVVYKQDIRSMLHIIKEGKLLGLLIDQDASSEGIFVDFFGKIASTPQGAGVFARLKNIQIVPAFITQIALGKHNITIHKPILMKKTLNREKDIFDITQKLTKIIEIHIRKKPHEWFWLHNRWKTCSIKK